MVGRPKAGEGPLNHRTLTLGSPVRWSTAPPAVGLLEIGSSDLPVWRSTIDARGVATVSTEIDEPPAEMSTADLNHAAERYALLLRELLGENLVSIVLYGSVARGEARADSDIDLLIVCGTLPEGRFARLRLLDAAERRIEGEVRALRAHVLTLGSPSFFVRARRSGSFHSTSTWSRMRDSCTTETSSSQACWPVSACGSTSLAPSAVGGAWFAIGFSNATSFRER